MRQIDREESMPLGPAKPRPEPEPQKPAEVEIRPGVIRGGDGKLRTNMPENEQANGSPPWPYIYIGSPETWGLKG
jgi:hypothetical protein